MAVGTRNLLDRDVRRAERPAELRDGGQALEPGRARKDVDVHGAGLRPGVQHGVRLGQDQHAGQARRRERRGTVPARPSRPRFRSASTKVAVTHLGRQRRRWRCSR